MQSGKFNCVVDSAWGSSGKGAVSTRLADVHGVYHLSSANYPNAGHTVCFDDRSFVFKCLPSGAALNSFVKDRWLWLGANSGIDQDVLLKEIKETDSVERVIIHDRAMIVEDRHRQAEAGGGSQSTLAISSTMSGSGAAITEKAMRQPNVKLARDLESTLKLYCRVARPWDFWDRTNEQLEAGNTFLHEVSQGFALSLNWGTHYPHCTSRDCTPQQAYADFGIQAKSIGDVYLNVRSFPIRVGNNFDADGNQIGYSGDAMPDCKETSWEEIGANAEMPTNVIEALAEKERTTVTKKIRRVFTPSFELLRFSAKFSGATHLVLNFPQYIHWSAYKKRGGSLAFSQLHRSVRSYVERMEAITDLPVAMIGTGPDHYDFICP